MLSFKKFPTYFIFTLLTCHASGNGENEVFTCDPHLLLFKNCLLFWKQLDLKVLPTLNLTQSTYFSTFYKLHNLIFSDAAHIFQTGNTDPPPNNTRASERNISALPKNPPQYTKYSTCHLTFHEVHFHQLAPMIVRYGESDTDFVIYFTNENLSSIEPFIEENLSRLNYSGIPMFLNYVGGLNVLTRGISAKSKNPPKFTTLADIVYYWNSECSTEKQLLIRTIPSSVNFTKCKVKSRKVFLQELEQVTCLLVNHLNISHVLIPFNMISDIDMLQGAVLNVHLASTVISGKSSWTKYGFPMPTVNLKKYAYIIVAPDDSLANIGAMSQPFHVSVWISIFASMLLMPLALLITTAKTLNLHSPKWTLTAYVDWTFLTLASVVDQCNDEVERFFKSWQSAGLWLVWNFFSLIISNCYDGQLYSFLASDQTPVTPNTLRQLANVNLPVISISTTMRIEDGSRKYSSELKGFLVRPNKTNTERFLTRLQNWKLPEYYGRLAKNVHHISIVGKDIVNISLEVMDFDKNMNSSEGYALLDSEYHVNILGPVLDMQENRRIVKRQNVKNFNSLGGWVVRRFFAFNRIDRVLWQITESGLHDLWHHSVTRRIQVHVATQIYKKGKRKSGRVVNNLIGYMMHISKQGQGHKASWEEEPKPMSLDMLRGILRVCVILGSISVTCVLVEYTYKRVNIKPKQALLGGGSDFGRIIRVVTYGESYGMREFR